MEARGPAQMRRDNGGGGGGGVGWRPQLWVDDGVPVASHGEEAEGDVRWREKQVSDSSNNCGIIITSSSSTHLSSSRADGPIAALVTTSSIRSPWSRPLVHCRQIMTLLS